MRLIANLVTSLVSACAKGWSWLTLHRVRSAVGASGAAGKAAFGFAARVRRRFVKPGSSTRAERRLLLAVAWLGLLSWLLLWHAAQAQERVAEPVLTLTSPVIEAGGRIPERYTCNGADVSPELRWQNVPPKAKSLVLIVKDPDAPRGIFVHWVVYNIPSSAAGLPQGVSPVSRLNDGTMQGANSFGVIGYRGPCPPPGGKHHYHFELMALDAKLEMPERPSAVNVEAMSLQHIIAQAELVGIYGR